MDKTCLPSIKNKGHDNWWLKHSFQLKVSKSVNEEENKEETNE